MRTALLAFLVLLSSALVRADEVAADRYDIRLRKIADGVFVAYRPEPLRPYVEGNVTIIVNEKDVVVVDASGSPRTARKVIGHIRGITPNPVRYVVLTHIHRDHRFGLQEYLTAFPGVEVVAHPIVREVIDRPASATFVADAIKRLERSRTTTEDEIARLRAEGRPGHETVIAHLQRYLDRDLPPILAEYPGIVNLGPTATVSDRLVLHRGPRTIEILFLGRGDTDHDLVVYLPAEKIIAAGDMVVHPFPYGFSTQQAEWLTTLRKLQGLDYHQLVPGHGDVQNGKTHVGRIIALVEATRSQVASGIAAGLDADAVRKRVNLSTFESELAGDDAVRRHYFHEYYVKPAVEQALKELKQ